jgi:hypothetical protein
VQALDRTAPILPLRPGLPEMATHKYVRHGATTLFPGLGVATGWITDACYPPAPPPRSLALPAPARQGIPAQATAHCRGQLRHAQAPGRAGQAREEPQDQLHLTPTSGSWLKMVKIFFGITTRQAICRDTFTSVRDLITKIETVIDGWNGRC